MTEYSLKSFAPANWPDWKFFGLSQNSGEHLTTAEAYAAVPYVFNAVAHIAGSLSTLPYIIERGEEDVTEEYAPVAFEDFLYLDAAWLLLFGASYFKPSNNRYGAAQWTGLFPGQMTYEYVNNELTRFRFQGSVPQQDFSPDDPKLLWQWWPNVSTPQGPGVCPAMNALGDAGLIYRLGQFANLYFLRGGKFTLLKLPPNTQQDQVDKVEKWWAKVATGVRAWFKGIAIRSDLIDPVAFGSDLKDTVAPEMKTQAAEGVAISFNLPLTVVMSNYAAFATAEIDLLMKYENAVLPLARRIFARLNEKYFMPQGVKIRANEKALPVYQNQFLQLAGTVQTLTTPNEQGVALLTQNEGRVILGRPPRPVLVAQVSAGGGKVAAPQPLNGAQISSALEVLNGMAAGTIAQGAALPMIQALGIDAATAQAMIAAQSGLSGLALPTGATTPGQVNAPAEPDKTQQVNSVLTNLTGMQQVNLSRIIRKFNQGKMGETEAVLLLTSGFGVTQQEAMTLLGVGDTEMPPQSAVASLDLERWQRKSLNALQAGKSAAVAFASDSIPATEHERITAALANCKTAEDVRGVFGGQRVSETMQLVNEIRLAREALGNGNA